MLGHEHFRENKLYEERKITLRKEKHTHLHSCCAEFMLCYVRLICEWFISGKQTRERPHEGAPQYSQWHLNKETRKSKGSRE